MSRPHSASQSARTHYPTTTVSADGPQSPVAPALAAAAINALAASVRLSPLDTPANTTSSATATPIVPRPHPRRKSLLWDFSPLLLLAAVLASGLSELCLAETVAPTTAVAAAKSSPSPTVGVMPAPTATPPLGAATTLWTVSSRNAHWNHGEAHPKLAYWWYDSIARRWTPSTREMFLANDAPGVPTCFFVHGNRISHQEAFQVGWRAYQRVAAQAGPERPFRFVIWSWPSTQIHGQLKDVRAKAYQSDAHAVYLSALVDQINPQTPVSLIGYSYGARLITGSLHILGGGKLAGRFLAHRRHPDRLPVRVVLMAGAVDNYALRPNARNGLALSQVDRMLVMTNPADDVLRYYRLLYGLHGQTQAIGVTGAAGIGYETNKVAHWNVTRYVGSEHDWQRYLSPSVVAGIRDYALFTQ